MKTVSTLAETKPFRGFRRLSKGFSQKLWLLFPKFAVTGYAQQPGLSSANEYFTHKFK